MVKNLLAFIFGLSIAVFMLEAFLRIYDPFGFRVRGDKIVLAAHHKEFFTNDKTPKLDSFITITTNDLGFRGADKPTDFEDKLSIIAIGGSTTHCYYSSDGKEWPALLEEKLKPYFPNIWLNNAGLDGQTTFGHQILLSDYIVDLRPDIVLFYIGINDVGTVGLKSFDESLIKGNKRGFVGTVLNSSELANVVFNLVRSWRAKKHQLTHDLLLDIRTEDQLQMSDSERTVVEGKTITALEGYKGRVQSLIDTCRKYGIEPIFITQPVLYGAGKDVVTGVDLEDIKVWDDADGKTVWQMLQRYNQTTIEIAKNNNCGVVDIAEKMPKNSDYYYDLVHYSNEGNVEISELIFEQLLPILQEQNLTN